MRHTVKLIFCLLLVGIILGACAGKPDTPALPENETQSQAFPKQTQEQLSSDDETYVLKKGLNWENIVFGRGSYDYIVYDNDGNEIFKDRGTPNFTMMSETLLRADQSGGTGILLTRFFDVAKGLYSPQYENVLATDFGQVTYLDFTSDSWPERNISLAVHDIFDPELNPIKFQRDFRMITWEDPHRVTVKFTNKNQLFVEYYNSKDEMVKETLELK